jgi:hypothetical protein
MIAKAYHVSVAGDDRNCGTPDRPFRSIARAAEIAGPGDTVTVHAGNLYLRNARPWRHEKNAAAPGDAAPGIAFEWENGTALLHLKVDECIRAVDTAVVSTETLGCAFQSEAPYESADGSPLVIDSDYFGNARSGGKPLPGPFAALGTGQQTLRLFARKPWMEDKLGSSAESVGAESM